MEENKVLLAIAEELKSIKKELGEIKASMTKANDNETEKSLQTDYVTTTEQRFIKLSQRVDRLIAVSKEQKFVQTVTAIGGITLGTLVITKEVVQQIINYVATR